MHSDVNDILSNLHHHCVRNPTEKTIIARGINRAILHLDVVDHTRGCIPEIVNVGVTNGGGTAFKDGTSMAAPHVAGALAVLRQWSPTAPVWRIIDNIAQSGREILDSTGLRKRRLNIWEGFSWRNLDHFLPGNPWTDGAYYGDRGTYFADVTGDGKSDAIVVNSGSISVRPSEGGAFGGKKETSGVYFDDREPAGGGRTCSRLRCRGASVGAGHRSRGQ